MKLIITQAIEKTELLPWKKVFPLEVIQKAAKKALKGIGRNIRSSAKLPKTHLKKLNLTGPGGAGRVIFLLEVDSEVTVLVLIRAKNDKMIGANMTIKNSSFKKLLAKNIDLILRDLDSEQYDEYEL